VLVTPDMLGLYDRVQPRFVKHYAEIGNQIRQAVETYAAEVRAGVFPDDAHSYAMRSEEAQRLADLVGAPTPERSPT
jgi:3-methyl-2-oxobutanoate hydroxymethyltransferase